MSIRLFLEILVGVLIALRIAQRLLARRRRREAAGGARCPTCGADRLVVTESISLPASIELAAIACRRCALRGLAVREGSDERRAFPMDPLAWGRLSAALRRCPAPRDPDCACPEHARFARREGSVWRGLEGVPHDEAAAFTLPDQRSEKSA